MKQEAFNRSAVWRESERVLSLRVADDPRLDEDALCPETDPEIFFPEKGGSTRDAKKVCGACAVRAACLEYALDHDEKFGIWGGLTERERRKVKKSRRQPRTNKQHVA
jgi:WhiB family redox-sensing transcriptional regulator